jgi:hypothetical protein
MATPRSGPLGHEQPSVEVPAANVQSLSLKVGRRFITRHTGIFLFWPLLAKWDSINW